MKTVEVRNANINTFHTTFHRQRGKFLHIGRNMFAYLYFQVATVGRRLKLRRKYVQLLDKFFTFAATKLEEQKLEEECVEEEEDREDDRYKR